MLPGSAAAGRRGRLSGASRAEGTVPRDQCEAAQIIQQWLRFLHFLMRLRQALDTHAQAHTGTFDYIYSLMKARKEESFAEQKILFVLLKVLMLIPVLKYELDHVLFIFYISRQS